MKCNGLHLAAIFFLLALGFSPVFAGSISIPGGLTREFTVSPGEIVQGKILLSNNTDEPQGVKVYQTDYLFFADGRNNYAEPGSLPRSNGKWIEYSPSQVIIAPKSTDQVNFSIKVPREASLKGTYWSMFMVEGLGKDSPEMTTEPGKVKVGIRTILRYGIQIVTNIGSSGTRSLKFIDKRLEQKDGKKTLGISLENTGERWLRPSVWAELFDGKGVSLGRFGGQQRRLFPGCSTAFLVDFSEVQKGTYTALVVADNGDESVFGARYQIEIP